jgi:2-polyprenyl-3-methyl-5-hydroxy-6-metoxy-1,4-benzoquinol methylase
MNCRFCNNPLSHEFVDLVNSPPSNAFLTSEQLAQREVFYPLKLFVCEKCFLVQVDEHKNSREIFNKDYVYFSSFSNTWLEHAKAYVCMIRERIVLSGSSLVIEIGSNDGYLLQYFKKMGVPCLGIEPTSGTAEKARDKGIETIEDFFSETLATELVAQGKKADLVIGNNVLAHVPDINDFVKGIKIILANEGIATLEFPHLMQLVEKSQFDTIYHEHFSYLSFSTANRIFARHGLVLFDVEELSTHGGSIRIYVRHDNNEKRAVSQAVQRLLEREDEAGMNSREYYQGFQKKVDTVKYELVTFLLDQKRKGKKLAAYGAAAKGNTLFNYCGIKKDLVAFVADKSPYKQGKFLPGSHIPVVHENEIKMIKPDFILILPWNIKTEIIRQLEYVRSWQCQFVLAIPTLYCY